MVNKEIKPYVAVMTVLFFLAVFLGYFEAAQNKEEARQTVDQLFGEFSFIENLNSFEIFLFIFFNNSVKALMAILLGFFFGIVPLAMVLFNGYIIGMVAYVSKAKIGLPAVIAGLGPHGILEIPAFLLASSYGLWLGVKFYRKIRHKEAFKDALFFSLEKYFKVILLLFFIAAIIEAIITPALILFFK